MATDDGVDDHCDREGKGDDVAEHGGSAVDDSNHKKVMIPNRRL